MALADRAQKIILKPKEEWPVIAAEPATVGSIFTGYVIPLAAIGPIAGLVGSILFMHRSPIVGIVTGALTFVLALVGVFVMSLIAEALAPSFNGTKDRVQALKLVAYAQTPAWVFAILGIFPPLAIIAALAGLYGLYVLYLGVTPVMGVPAEKSAVYTLVLIVVAIVVYAVVAAVVGAVIGTMLLTTGAMLVR